MPTENQQTLSRAYDAFARRDIATVLAAFAPDITWHVPDSLPFGGDYRGHDGVTAFFGHLSELWTELAVEPQEFIAAGDTIVVRVRLTGTGAGGSVVVEGLHLWRMRAGRATAFTDYSDTARELQAIGATVPAPA